MYLCDTARTEHTQQKGEREIMRERERERGGRAAAGDKKERMDKCTRGCVGYSWCTHARTDKANKQPIT